LINATGSYAITGSNTFIGSQIIEGNLSFPSNSFVSTDNVSGALYFSSLNQGTLYLNGDGGEGDVVIGYSAWQNNLKVKGGNTEITGSLGVTNIKGTGSLFLQPNQSDARLVEIYNTSPTDTHITASGGQIFLGDDQTYVKVDNYGSVERIDVVAGNELVVSSSIVNLTGSLHQSGTFYPDVIDWVSSSIVQSTGSYILTTNISGVTEYDSYQNVASALQQYINTGSIPSGTVSGSAQIVELGFATTGSNVFQGLQTISGSLIVTGSITALSASITYLQTVYQTSSVVFSSGSNILGDEASDTQTLNGVVNIPLGNLNVTGATTSSLGFFGNLQGTASYATNALSASHSVNSNTSISSSFAQTAISSSQAQNAVSASQATNSNTASYVLQAVSASYANNATSASFSQNTISGSFSNFAVSSSYAQTASFASNGGVTQILAGPNIIVSPLSGQGQVTISSTGTGTGSFNTATGSYGSFYDTTTQVNPVANTPNSMSFNETAITNGVSISGSLSPFNTYIKTQNAGVYNIQFSAQVDKTDSGTDSVDIWIRKNGIDLLDTATTVTLTGNNDKSVAAWNWFVQSATNDYYQLIWASADTDMRLLAEASSSVHPGVPSVILTANRVDQFLSNTGSFNGDFNGSFTGSLQGTASFATNALSASYAPMPDVSYFATTGSNVFKGNQTISGSLLTNTLNDGLIKIVTEAQNSSSLAVPFGYISASAAVSQSNLIFGTSTGLSGNGQLSNNLTGSIVLSGSNNIIQVGGNRASTLSQGTYGYINGNINFVSAYPTLTTSSILRPSINNNNLNSAVAFAFTTSSLGTPQFSNNNVQNTITINHQSGSLSYTSNINVGAVTSTANNIALPFLTSIGSNYMGGSGLFLNHISSSITATNNIFGGGAFSVTNLVSSSVSATNNGLSLLNNLVVGQTLGVWVSGSNPTNRRNITANIIGGVNTAVSSSQVGAEAHLYGTIVYGQNLIVSASHASNIGGSTFVGRYNDTTTLSDSQNIVFAVGTGTAVGTRRTGLYVTSGSLVGVSGSLQVIGNTTMTGSLTLSGSAGPELIVIGDSEVTGTLKVTAGITGSLEGTASYATNALTASFALNGGGGGGSAFPFTGSAIISGSLEVIGTTVISSSVANQASALTVNGYINAKNVPGQPYSYIQISSNNAAGGAGVSIDAQNSSFLFDVGVKNSNSLTLFDSGANNSIAIFNTGSAGKIQFKRNTEITGSVQGNVTALSISSNTASLDLNTGNFFTLQLVSGSATHINPSNIKPGQTINILLSTTGSGTVNFPSSVKQVSGSSYVPTTTTSKDIITLVSFDSSSLFLANVKNLV
jgi:hypothetical protein